MGVSTLRPALRNGQTSSRHGEPNVQPYIASGSTNPIRILDPITLSSGRISRGDNTSTALLGFAQNGTVRPSSPQIAQFPTEYDSATGSPNLGVYVADNVTYHQAAVKSSVALSLSHEGTVCDLAPELVSPTPVLTTGGSAGSTSYTYQVTARNTLGESKPLSATTISTGNAALSGTNYNIVTIPLVTNAVTFVVYRGGVQIAEVTANPLGTTVLNDTNLVGTGAAVGSTNESGWVIDPTASSTNVIKINKLVDAVGTYGGVVEFMVAPSKSQWLV